MCGATGAQYQLQQEQIDAYQEAQNLMQEQYANQQAIWSQMSPMFEKIFALGPSQEGFSAAETNTLNAQAVEGTAENYEQAAKATNEQEAAVGGGNAYMPSGGAAQLKEEVATSAAQSESQQETQIKEADYQQGYQEWLNAGEGLQAIAAGENPLGYEQGATSAGGAASETANQIASEQNSWINAALGAAGGVASSVISENPGGVFD
jgi:hypothetical protein